MSLTKILSFLKLKGVEITAEEAAALADQTAPTTPQIQQLSDTDFKHNKKLFEEMQSQFAEQMKQQQEMFEAKFAAAEQHILDLTNVIAQERQIRDEGIKINQEIQEKNKQTQAEELINQAVTSQKIPAQNAELIKLYMEDAVRDYNGTKMRLENITPIAAPQTPPKPVGQENKPSTLDRAVASTALPHFINLVEDGFAKIDNN